VTNLSRCEVPFESVNGWEVEIRPMVLCGWNRIDPSGLFAVVVVLVVMTAVAAVTAVVGLTIAPVVTVVTVGVVVEVVVVGGADCELVVVEDSSESDIFKY